MRYACQEKAPLEILSPASSSLIFEDKSRLMYDAGEISLRWNQIVPSILNNFEKLKTRDLAPIDYYRISMLRLTMLLLIHHMMKDSMSN